MLSSRAAYLGRSIQRCFGSGAKGFLNPRQYQPVKLVAKAKVSPSCYSLTFSSTGDFYMPAGLHVSFRAPVRWPTYAMRSYTPLTPNGTFGRLDFIVKTYQGGVMSQYLANMKVGDKIDVLGPIGKFPMDKIKNNNIINCVGGGTGITPFYGIALEVLSDPFCEATMNLISLNDSEEEHLMREEFDHIQANSEGRFTITYVTKAKEETHSQLVQRALAKFHHVPFDAAVLLCGPPQMEIDFRSALLSDYKYLIKIPESNVWMFTERAKSTPESSLKKPKVDPSNPPSYTLADVAKHKEPGDCWTAIEGLVYDISDYIGDHPGGPIALEAAGKDGTKLFVVDYPHFGNAREDLKPLLIGKLVK